MYPVEKKSLHDPISSALSAERRGSTVVKKRLVHEGTGSRRKTVRGALGAQSAPRTSKLGGASGHSGGGGGMRRGSAAVLGEKEKKVEPIRSASETLSPREVEKAKLLRPASSLVAPTNINVKEKGVGGGGLYSLGVYSRYRNLLLYLRTTRASAGGTFSRPLTSLVGRRLGTRGTMI